MRYRLIYFGLGCLLVAVVALGIAFNPTGTSTPLPPPVESVFPLPNDAALRQAFVEVDMSVGYTLVLYVDGFRVPESEITVIEATGVYRWSPSPLSAYLTEWSPGEHEVRIEWDSVAGPADVGTFVWTFRIQ